MSEILVYSDSDGTAFELVSQAKRFAKELNATVSAALLGEGAAGKADEFFSYGADKLLVSEHPALKDFYVGTYADALRQIAESGDVEYLLLGSTKRGKELAGRVAEKLNAGAITDANAVLFDAANSFAGCIPGVHEVLRRQGLLEGTWCLDPGEVLSPGQAEELDRIYKMYPRLTDDDFVAQHRIVDPGPPQIRSGIDTRDRDETEAGILEPLHFVGDHLTQQLVHPQHAGTPGHSSSRYETPISSSSTSGWSDTTRCTAWITRSRCPAWVPTSAAPPVARRH